MNEHPHRAAWPPLASWMAQWTVRSLSSLPVMQRCCLLLRWAAMLSEWKPGVSETSWGRNPWPSTLSAGEYQRLSGRGCVSYLLSDPRCLNCRSGGLWEWVNGECSETPKRLPPFQLPASFLSLCRSSAPDSSWAFVSIRVTGTGEAAGFGEQVETSRCTLPSKLTFSEEAKTLLSLQSIPCLAVGSSLWLEAVLLLVETDSKPSVTGLRLLAATWKQLHDF